MKKSACIEMLFSEVPFDDRFGLAKESGFEVTVADACFTDWAREVFCFGSAVSSMGFGEGFGAVFSPGGETGSGVKSAEVFVLGLSMVGSSRVILLSKSFRRLNSLIHIMKIIAIRMLIMTSNIFFVP